MKSKTRARYGESIPDKIPITRFALEKILQIASTVKDMGYARFEWYAYLLSEKGDNLVTDVVIAPNQRVNSASVEVSSENVILTGQEINELSERRGVEYYPIGWTHSHGTFMPFHSGTDDHNQTILTPIAMEHNSTFVGCPYTLFEKPVQVKALEDRVSIEGGSWDGRIEVKMDPEKLKQKFGAARPDLAYDILRELLQASEFQLFMPKCTGYAYSIVVNNAGAKPFALIGRQTFDGMTGQFSYEQEETSLDIRNVSSRPYTTSRALFEEIREKINFPGMKKVSRPQRKGFLKIAEDFVEKALQFTTESDSFYSIVMKRALDTSLYKKMRFSRAFASSFDGPLDPIVYRIPHMDLLVKRCYYDCIKPYREDSFLEFMHDFSESADPERVMEERAGSLYPAYKVSLNVLNQFYQGRHNG